MRIQNLARATLALAAGALILSSSAVAQDMPMPKPGPEHKLFDMDAGTWDATVEMFMPGAPPMTSKGTETNTIGCGGLCLISDFKSVMAGAPFHGHGTSAWDPAKKKYVGTWTDSMSAGISMSEMTYDPATKTATGWHGGTRHDRQAGQVQGGRSSTRTPTTASSPCTRPARTGRKSRR